MKTRTTIEIIYFSIGLCLAIIAALSRYLLIETWYFWIWIAIGVGMWIRSS